MMCILVSESIAGDILGEPNKKSLSNGTTLRFGEHGRVAGFDPYVSLSFYAYCDIRATIKITISLWII